MKFSRTFFHHRCPYTLHTIHYQLSTTHHKSSNYPFSPKWKLERTLCLLPAHPPFRLPSIHCLGNENISQRQNRSLYPISFIFNRNTAEYIHILPFRVHGVGVGVKLLLSLPTRFACSSIHTHTLSLSLHSASLKPSPVLSYLSIYLSYPPIPCIKYFLHIYIPRPPKKKPRLCLPPAPLLNGLEAYFIRAQWESIQEGGAFSRVPPPRRLAPPHRFVFSFSLWDGWDYVI